MSAERAPIKVLLRDEQSGGAVSVIESGSLPGFMAEPNYELCASSMP